MASFLYQTNGTIVPVSPGNGSHWTLKELQGLVGGYIELGRTIDGRWLVLNELGKVLKEPLPLNVEATKIYTYGQVDPLVGPVVVVDTKLELDGPEEKQEGE